MKNTEISNEKERIQCSDVGLNLVGPTITPLDSDFLRINSEFAKKFERLNAGAIE